MSLIRKHGLTIDKSLVVVLVMQSGCSWTTTANRKVRFHTANVVVLLASVDKETFKLALAHTWLAVLHDRDMGLCCDLTGPSQSQDFNVVLYCSRLAQDVVHLIIVDLIVCKVLFFWDLRLKLGITVDTSVNIDSRV